MIWKLIISLFASIISIACLIVLFLGELYKDTISLIILLSLIFTVILAGFLIYFLITKLTKTRYVFDDKGIHETYKDSEKLFISWESIYELIYPKVWWIFLLQFGSGQLNIRYANQNNEQKVHQVSFSLKEIKLIERTFNKIIIIK